MKPLEYGTLRHQIARAIKRNGGMEIAQIRLCASRFSRSTVKNAVLKMLSDGQLTRTDGVYALSAAMAKQLNADEADLLQMPARKYVSPFKPLQAKNMPSLKARRADCEDAREWHPLNGGTQGLSWERM